jgi:hypothetical protein
LHLPLDVGAKLLHEAGHKRADTAANNRADVVKEG